MGMAAFVSRRNPNKLIGKMKYKLASADQSALNQPVVRQTLAQNFRDAYKNGGRGAAQDIINQANPWPFALEEIKMPVHIWQPEDDTSTPIAMGRYLGKTIPNSLVHFIPNAGHLWHIEHLNEVLGMLTPIA
jgi:pimeloyl-ACP methyl ester carboxylesterase